MARPLALVAALAVLVCTAASAHAASPLAGQWHLDATGPGNTTPDSSDNGLTATSAVAIGLGAGRFGNALTGSGVLKAGTSPLLAPPRLTLMAWIKQSGTPPVLRYIAGRGDDGAPTCLGSSYAIYTGYPGNPGLRFYIRESAADNHFTANAPASTFDGAWHMLAGVFDGSFIRFYVDGTETGLPVQVTGPPKYDFSGSDFYMDGYPAACGNADFPGAIDEVRLYDRALNGTELRRLAAETGPVPPDLLPDGDEDGVPDASDNCPSTANPDQADADADGAGDPCDGEPLPREKPQKVPPRAAFEVLSAACAGSATKVDASASQQGTGGPIVSYLYQYIEQVPRSFGGLSGARAIAPITAINSLQVQVQLAETAAAQESLRFPWAPASTDAAVKSDTLPVSKRPSVDLQLTVTDASGEKATATRAIAFQQTASDKPRTGCPDAGDPIVAKAQKEIAQSVGSVSAATIGAAIAAISQAQCQSALACAGQAVVATPNFKITTRVSEKQAALDALKKQLAADDKSDQQRKDTQDRVRQTKETIQKLIDQLAAISRGQAISAAKTKPKPKRKPDVLGAAPFLIPAGGKANVAIPLSPAARNVLVKYGTLRVTYTLASVTPIGKRVIKEKVLVLKAPKKKPKPKASTLW